MKTLEKRRLRRTDRLGDRLQNQFQELLSPYFVTEDEIMLLTENPDYIIEEHVMRTRFTITEDILRREKQGWIIEDDVVMQFGDETIREDILKRAKAGFVLEDHIMMLVKDRGIYYMAPVRYADTKEKRDRRTIALIGFIDDKNPKQKSFAGKLVGTFNEKGELKDLALMNNKNQSAGKLTYKGSVHTLVKDPNDPNEGQEPIMGKKLAVYVDGEYVMTVEYQQGFFWETVYFWGGFFGADGWNTYNHNN